MRFSRELVPGDQLVQYVLGQLPEAETERLDEASIVDDVLALRLRGVENDLVDAYVSDTLDRDTRARFEIAYLAMPRRREKVEFARRFLATVDGAAAAPVISPAPRRAWSLPAAAALLLAVSGGLLYQDLRLHNAAKDAERQIAIQTQRATSLARQLDGARAVARDAQTALERAAAAQRDQRSAPAGPTASAAARPAVAIVLLPQTRSVGPVPTVAVPATAERVAFQLRLEANDFPVYQAALKDPGTNRIVWRSAQRSAQSRRGHGCFHQFRRARSRRSTIRSSSLAFTARNAPRSSVTTCFRWIASSRPRPTGPRGDGHDANEPCYSHLRPRRRIVDAGRGRHVA
jgi:hypothetical protein